MTLHLETERERALARMTLQSVIAKLHEALDLQRERDASLRRDPFSAPADPAPEERADG